MTNNIRVTVREHADDLFDGQDVTGDVSASAEALYDLFDGALCLSEETAQIVLELAGEHLAVLRLTTAPTWEHQSQEKGGALPPRCEDRGFRAEHDERQAVG